MKDLHWASNNTLGTPDAGSISQSDGLTFQGSAFDIDSHLAELIADIAINAFSFFWSDFELGPASPEIHPKCEGAPHPAPDSLAEERVHADRNGPRQQSAHPDVVPLKNLGCSAEG